jgi:hypothetical protein
VGGECRPQNPLVLGKQLAVAAAQLFEQLSRPFDVRKQEGDGAAVKLRRGSPYDEGRLSFESCQALPRPRSRREVAGWTPVARAQLTSHSRHGEGAAIS